MNDLLLANGQPMPALGLGTWRSSPGQVRDAVRTAIETGYRHIDCADAYDNETEVGQGLRDGMASGVSRDALWITSKLWNRFHAPDDVRPALEKTLRHLGLDHLDLYLMHWPVAMRKDAERPFAAEDFIALEQLPIFDTWQAMEACVDAGLVRHIGVSNFSIRKLSNVLEHGRIKPAMNQVEMHPYLQQPALKAYCDEHGISMTAYSPLGSGAGHAGDDDVPVVLEDATITAIADELGATPAQILIAWALRRGTAVIPKSVHAERIRQNFAAGEITLDDGHMARIDALDRHHRYVLGNVWTIPGSSYTAANLWDE